MGVHVEMPGLGDGDVLYRLQDLGNGRTRVEQDCRFRYQQEIDRLSDGADERAEEILGQLYDWADAIAPEL